MMLPGLETLVITGQFAPREGLGIGMMGLLSDTIKQLNDEVSGVEKQAHDTPVMKIDHRVHPIVGAFGGRR